MASRVVHRSLLKLTLARQSCAIRAAAPSLASTSSLVVSGDSPWFSIMDVRSQQRRWLGRKGAKMGRHLETLEELAHSESHREARERHKAKKQKKKKHHNMEKHEDLVPIEEDEEETKFDEEKDDIPVLPDPEQVKERMLKVVYAIEESFKGIRGAEPTPEIFDPITVEAYGEYTPLSSVAQVVIDSPTLATVTCFDPALAKDVKTAIMLELELNPQLDGEDGVVRVPLPRPSAESRQKTVHQLGQQAEGARTRIRNIRRAALEVVKKGEKGKLAGISKDDAFRVQKEIDAVTDTVVQQLNQAVQEKQDSVMAV